jgi:DNA polymerase-3 subunit gamma/tau
MSYLVLARKWRPQNFEDIVGQGHATRVLANAIKANRVAHAYLFTGVRGVGKTTAARILAKALNCLKGPTPTPCNECTNCAEIIAGNSIDVYEIDGASNRGIDEVRQIIENVRYQPAKSRFKIYIIDEVHQVTEDAFNALLKTLEEPPPFVKFILATTEPHRLPETILSRCQRFDFRRIPVREIAQRLREIAKAEDLKIADGALLLLARESEGSMRDAQSLLEQVLAYGGTTEERAEIDAQLLQDILGVAERKTLSDLSRAVIDGDPKRCMDVVGNVAAQGLDMGRLSRELVEHFRNLLVVRLSQDRERRTEEPGSQPRGAGLLLDLPDQEVEELKGQAKDLSVDTLMDYFNFMAEGDEEVARSAYPRFALEATLARLATLPKTMPVGELLQRLETLERKLSDGGSVPRPREEREAKRVQETGRPAAPDSPKDQDKAEVWRNFLAFVMKEKKFLGSHLENVRPLEISPGEFRIGVEERHVLSYLRDAENLSLLKDFARRFFSTDVNVAVTALPPKAQTVENQTVNPVPLAGREGDMVKETLRIFGGSVKEVKREG